MHHLKNLFPTLGRSLFYRSFHWQRNGTVFVRRVYFYFSLIFSKLSQRLVPGIFCETFCCTECGNFEPRFMSDCKRNRFYPITSTFGGTKNVVQFFFGLAVKVFLDGDFLLLVCTNVVTLSGIFSLISDRVGVTQISFTFISSLVGRKVIRSFRFSTCPMDLGSTCLLKISLRLV